MTEQCDLVSDLDFIDKVKNGDKQAFSTLVKRHQRGLMRLSLRFMKDKDAAEDVVQEAFIKAYEKLDTFESRASFKSWLYQIAVNTAKNRLRERKEFVDVANVPLAVGAKAESEMLKMSMADTIHALVDKLPFRQKTALQLRIYEDLSFKEIAEIMECPYDTAKANYRHALMKLKEDLEEFKDFHGGDSQLVGWSQELNTRIVEVEP